MDLYNTDESFKWLFNPANSKYSQRERNISDFKKSL